MVVKASQVGALLLLGFCAAAIDGASSPAWATEPPPMKVNKKPFRKDGDEKAGAKATAPEASTTPTSWYVWCDGAPDEGPAPLTVKFEADPIEEIPSPKYTWDFGDGSDVQKGQKISHTYKKPGIYTARCKATDPNGGSGDDTVQIEVTAPEPKKDGATKKDAPAKKK